jgi:hypothetical protein
MMLDYVTPSGFETDEAKNRWEMFMEGLKEFVRNSRREMAPRQFKNPWGPLWLCSQQLFWLERWIDDESGGFCWLKDLGLTMLNLDRWLERVRGNQWTGPWQERLMHSVIKLREFRRN